MIMLAARHGKIKYLPDVTAAYRRHSAGASNTDHKDDSKFLENRIMMYTNLDKDTGYKFHDKFKRNLGGWYYLLLNSKQYNGLYLKKLGVAAKYISLMYPKIPHLKLVLRDHIIPKFVMEITRKIRRTLGMIN